MSLPLISSSDISGAIGQQDPTYWYALLREEWPIDETKTTPALDWWLDNRASTYARFCEATLNRNVEHNLLAGELRRSMRKALQPMLTASPWIQLFAFESGCHGFFLSYPPDKFDLSPTQAEHWRYYTHLQRFRPSIEIPAISRLWTVANDLLCAPLPQPHSSADCSSVLACQVVHKTAAKLGYVLWRDFKKTHVFALFTSYARAPTSNSGWHCSRVDFLNLTRVLMVIDQLLSEEDGKSRSPIDWSWQSMVRFRLLVEWLCEWLYVGDDNVVNGMLKAFTDKEASKFDFDSELPKEKERTNLLDEAVDTVDKLDKIKKSATNLKTSN